MSKKIIFNDPIYGFIEVPHPFLYEVLNHPAFQRLRRIRQLGLTQLVYPGALHTRFQHAIGAMHLTNQAVIILRSKGLKITEEESIGVCAAVLLHDIGHAPFSHSLERKIVNCHHEDLTKLFFRSLNGEFGGKLSLAEKIFNNKYQKKFLSRLVSGQLDMDRLDYLNRDSFFCGVSEGVISSDRIIKMLEVRDDELAIESKGIYSVENFIIARRLMYWQVYLHKTVLGAENLLVNIILRAKEISKAGKEIFAMPALKFFLEKEYSLKEISSNSSVLKQYSELDDYDVFASVKSWMNHPDKILSELSRNLVNRNLFKTEIHNSALDKKRIELLKQKAMKKFKITEEECRYFVFSGELENKAYNPQEDRINILFKNGEMKDIADASDYLNISVISKSVKKFFLCYPKELV